MVHPCFNHWVALVLTNIPQFIQSLLMTFRLFLFEDNMNTTAVDNLGHVFWWKYYLQTGKMFDWFWGGRF